MTYPAIKLIRLVFIVWPLIAIGVFSSAATANVRHSDAESKLLAILELGQRGDYDSALHNLSNLIEARPNFRLAQLVYGELMVARAGRSIDPGLSARMLDRRDALLDEAKTRWAHRMSASMDGKVPDVLMQIAPAYQKVIVVDLSRNRLYLFANEHGVPRLISDVYATIGSAGAGKQVEGDMRTPIGIYHITGQIDDKALPELYGAGALPLNYPNALDRARERTGHGIWLHGVPRTTYARTPRASEGCVAIANDDFKRLRDRVNARTTPVIMAEDLNWMPAATVEKQRSAMLATIEEWRRSWQSIDTRAYLAHYSPDFVSTNGRDKAAFAAYKQNVNATKTDISVKLSQISIFRYPGEKNMVKVTFAQDYNSNNYRARTRRAQYWNKNDQGKWQIVLETRRH